MARANLRDHEVFQMRTTPGGKAGSDVAFSAARPSRAHGVQGSFLEIVADFAGMAFEGQPPKCPKLVEAGMQISWPK